MAVTHIPVDLVFRHKRCHRVHDHNVHCARTHERFGNLKRLFAEHGVIVSAKPEQRRLLQIMNETYDLGLDIPDTLKLFQLSEQHRRLVVINVQGLRRKEGSLLPEYTDEEFAEATFSFVKYYVQSVHYDTLVEENKKLRYELDQEMEWKTRTDG